ncbi:hypothetical protein Fmac_008509 [Flemingia macrophylla]|uniref:Trichome birefringence-like N-terminal domain-containing protein n=1 Tax=Flemingia macrophylla TaxID=520843 RepID=A0ABD1MXN7_9FABA
MRPKSFNYFLDLIFRNVILPSSKPSYASNLETKETSTCNIFSGNWVPYTKEPYYNNETCAFILDQLNCFKSGRPDREFLRWRWKPHDCDLPLFDATQFLKLVQGKSMAFVGDSMGRNQLESLLCLINTVAHPEDITAKHTSNDDIFFRWWFVADYKFTVTTLWSPFLVKFNDSDPSGRAYYSGTKLYLDEADTAWSSKIDNFDYVILSTGQWFFRPLTFYEKGQVVGCQKCGNTTELNYYGYRKAFRTAFGTMRGFKGLGILVSHSPEHFENGAWNEGGSCNRTMPFGVEERGVYKDGDIVEDLYGIQVEEFKEAREKGLKLGFIDITHAMALRPDGHPSRFRHANLSDCVHWCLPGPVDTWNQFLIHLIKLEAQKHKVFEQFRTEPVLQLPRQEDRPLEQEYELMLRWPKSTGVYTFKGERIAADRVAHLVKLPMHLTALTGHGVIKGWKLTVLESHISSLVDKEDWPTFNKTLALIVFGMILFPFHVDTVDHAAMDAFVAWDVHLKSFVPTILADILLSVNFCH